MDFSDNIPECTQNILQSFVCPITTLLVKDPIVASDGRIYEEDAFIEWIKRNKISPITRETVSKKYSVSIDIKNILDNLESIYPEIKEARYEKDLTYANNMSKIEKMIKKNKITDLLDYKEFQIKDMIKKRLIDKLLKDSHFKELDHIIEFCNDLDKDIVLLIIIKSLQYKNCRDFVNHYLDEYMILFHDPTSFGIIFNSACDVSNDVQLISDIMKRCDITALTFILNGNDWSYFIGKNRKLKLNDKMSLRKEYYNRLNVLIMNATDTKRTRINRDCFVSPENHIFFLNSSWNSLIYNDDEGSSEESYDDGSYEEASYDDENDIEVSYVESDE